MLASANFFAQPALAGNPLQRLGVNVTVNAHPTAAAKLDLDYSGPCAPRRRRRRRLLRCARRCRRDLDWNKSRHGLAAQAALTRLPTPRKQ